MGYMDYIEKLENCFHENFINMVVNKEMKFSNLKTYVEMLEEMLKERGVDIEKESYTIPQRQILVEDKDGVEHRWDIEKEHTDYYDVNHLGAITVIAKNKITNGKCIYKINIPKGCNRESLTYLLETGNVSKQEFLEEDLIDN